MDGLKVLCVEDNPVDARTLIEIIEDLGWSATHASNGLDAYAFAQTERYDIIVTDQNMEDLSGLGLFKCVRTGNGPNAKTPFLLNSASFTPEIIREAERMEVEAVIAKPLLKSLTMENLTHLVAQGPAANDIAEPSNQSECLIWKGMPFLKKFFR